MGYMVVYLDERVSKNQRSASKLISRSQFSDGIVTVWWRLFRLDSW